MFACGLLGGLAEFPWVVGHRPLGTLPFTLGSLSEYPWVLPVCSLLAFCLLLACRDARMRLYRVGDFSACYRLVVIYSVSGFFRVASSWSSLVGTVIHSSSQGKSPGAAHMSAPGCLVIVVQYVKPVGCLCLSGCRDAARHVSIDELAFSLLCVETRFRVLTS